MNKKNYCINDKGSKFHRYSYDGETFNPNDILKAAIETNKTIKTLTRIFKKESEMELFNVIDKKQTGAFVGAIFIEQLGNQASYLSKNPSQTGHPDLVPKKFIKKKKKKMGSEILGSISAWGNGSKNFLWQPKEWHDSRINDS